MNKKQIRKSTFVVEFLFYYKIKKLLFPVTQLVSNENFSSGVGNIDGERSVFILLNEWNIKTQKESE